MSTDSSNQAPLVAHLIELRNRLLKCVLAILILFIGLYSFANDLYLIVSEPLRLLLPAGSSLIATEVASPFLAPLKLTFAVAVLISVPYTLFQAWSFIAPALYKNEKQIAIPLLISSIFLFYAGVVFAYYVVLPLIFGPTFSTHRPRKAADNPNNKIAILKDHLITLLSTPNISLTGLVITEYA